ncbi:flagellar hook-length control protein FliK [Sulfitobacter sp. R18_1]|uniref:flagellar hook-length control protein FliK n=1 Tax=Sulfitobacter sp. R18_1 TaxID=2821104 RepID=UPI001ADB0E8A|nr:flagellar hook-length control protein FliK [Sulfitobacter sp. R18_1]MBO9428650.1 flagellar hook-length control protein FliK [Sulfitobacter sp. R18_1]
MNSTSIFSGVIPNSPQASGGANTEKALTADTSGKKSFVGFLSTLAAASANPAASNGQPILSKKQAMEGLKIASPQLTKGASNDVDAKLNASVKKSTDALLGGLMPGATAGQLNELKVKFSANINNLEKAMKSVLQQHGIPSPDIQVMPPEMIMVNLPDGLMDQLSNVLGAFVSGFDNASGTKFAQNLKISMQNLAASGEGDLKVDFEGFSPKNELEFVEAAIATVTTMMGVERPAKNGAPTATQTLMMAQHNAVAKTISKPQAGVASDVSMITQTTPKSMVGEAPAVGVWAPDETMEEGLKSFMRSTLFSSEATSRMGQEISKAMGGATSSNLVSGQSTVASTQLGGALATDASAMKPGMPDFARLDTFEAINQLSSESVSAEDFEDILSNSSKSKTTSDALTQAQANRFANLINAQIKTADLGDKKTRIELAPKGLGEIEINIENDASGKMRAVIRVENPAVLELMKTDKAQLMDLLSQKGIDLGDGSLDLEGFSKDEREEQGEGGQGNLSGDGEGGNVSDAPADTDPGPTISDTKIDIQI